MNEIDDNIQTKPNPEDEAYQKLKHLFLSTKKLSLEEKTQRKKELEKIRKEKGEKGVSEFLFKKFGLD